MEFTAELEPTGGNTAGFRVPQEVVDALSGGKRPKVAVEVNGFEFRSTVAPMGGDNWLGVSQERRAAAGISAGQTHRVRVELDSAPRVIEVPDELAEALAAQPEAKAFWDTLSYSNQRWHAEQITGRRSPRPEPGEWRSRSSCCVRAAPADLASRTSPRHDTWA